MTTKPLTEKLREKLVFDTFSSLMTHDETEDIYDMSDDGFNFVEGARLENARLAPWHELMIKCVEELEIELRFGMLGRGVRSGTANALADLEKELSK